MAINRSIKLRLHRIRNRTFFFFLIIGSANHYVYLYFTFTVNSGMYLLKLRIHFSFLIVSAVIDKTNASSPPAYVNIDYVLYSKYQSSLKTPLLTVCA